MNKVPSSSDSRPKAQSEADATFLLALSRLLWLGVVASAILVILGGCIYLMRHGREPVMDHSRFQPGPPEFSSPLIILQTALTGRGRAIIQTGLILLIATPILRVGLSCVMLARRRDWLYVAFTLLVLLVLVVGLINPMASR
jgi:uncharacterized membrane protein